MGSRTVEYKARVKNVIQGDGKEITMFKFAYPLRERLGTEYCVISVDGDGILIKPSEAGRKISDRMNIADALLVENLRPLNGEYHKVVLDDKCGGLRLLAGDRTGFKHEYKMKKKKQEPAKPASVHKSPYKNPYLGTTTKSSTLKGIVNEQCEKIEQLNRDIAEAQKLLDELTEERDRLLSIQEKASELIKLLGGNK